MKWPSVGRGKVWPRHAPGTPEVKLDAGQWRVAPSCQASRPLKVLGLDRVFLVKKTPLLGLHPLQMRMEEGVAWPL